MANSVVAFPRPVSILQVFRNVNVYGKDKRSFDLRREEVQWKSMVSSSGFVREGALFLPESLLEQPQFQNCELITLDDSMQDPKTDPGNQCFNLHHPNVLHIFRLQKGEELELFLKYGYFEVGAPRRNDHKLCDLRINEPVEIRINGKIDATLSSGQARQFKEQFYVFHFLGNFSECTVLKEPSAPVVKQVPTSRKTINLLKPLW